MRGTRVRSLGREDPQEKEMQPTPVLLPGKSHGQGSLVGYSPWGRKELDTTEQLHFAFAEEGIKRVEYSTYKQLYSYFTLFFWNSLLQ